MEAKAEKSASLTMVNGLSLGPGIEAESSPPI